MKKVQSSLNRTFPSCWFQPIFKERGSSNWIISPNFWGEHDQTICETTTEQRVATQRIWRFQDELFTIHIWTEKFHSLTTPWKII